MGYKNFSDFRTSRLGKLNDTSGYLETSYLSADEIPDGGILRIGWEPDRLLLIRRVGPILFEVVESHNSKLKVGDRFEASCFFKGLPLILATVYRDGEKLPSFIAGKEKGLNLLQVES